MAVEDDVTPIQLFNTSENISEFQTEMLFNDYHLINIITCTILMFFSAIGNIIFLSITLKKIKTSRSGINMILLHLAIADLLVTFLMMPLEIFWNVTVRWVAGETACRISAFLRIFGFYLSSFIMVCISIDRCFAVFKTNNTSNGNRRAKIMLTCAWVGSIILSIPQMIVFHIEKHYVHPWYEQCVTVNFFENFQHYLAYELLNPVMCFIFPLIVIIASSLIVFCKMYSKESINGRKQSRTLYMTFSILAVFVICWTPHNVMMLWYFLAPMSFLPFDFRIHMGLFFFGCTTFCMNPIIYGGFNIRIRNGAAGRVFLRSTSSSDITCGTDIDMSGH